MPASKSTTTCHTASVEDVVTIQLEQVTHRRLLLSDFNGNTNIQAEFCLTRTVTPLSALELAAVSKAMSTSKVSFWRVSLADLAA